MNIGSKVVSLVEGVLKMLLLQKWRMFELINVENTTVELAFG